FAVPAIGMTAGLIQYVLGYKKMGEAGLHPTIPSDPKRAARDRQGLVGMIAGLPGLIALGIALDSTGVLTPDKETIGNISGVGLLIAAVGLFVGLFKTARNHEERKRVTAMIPLFLGAIVFFALFEQASTTLSDYAERFVARDVIGIRVPASAYQ